MVSRALFSPRMPIGLGHSDVWGVLCPPAWSLSSGPAQPEVGAQQGSSLHAQNQKASTWKTFCAKQTAWGD